MIADGDFTDEQLLLTTVQAARVLGVGRTTVYELIKRGELRPVYISRCCRLSWAELERYVMRLDAVHAGGSERPHRMERRWRRVAGPSSGRPLVAVEALRPAGSPST
jgi:excisionase family DNA binding protein